MFSIFGHQHPGFGTGSGSGSTLRKNAGSGSVSGSAIRKKAGSGSGSGSVSVSGPAIRRNAISGSGSVFGSGSTIRKNARSGSGSGSTLNHCGSTTPVPAWRRCAASQAVSRAWRRSPAWPEARRPVPSCRAPPGWGAGGPAWRRRRARSPGWPASPAPRASYAPARRGLLSSFLLKGLSHEMDKKFGFWWHAWLV